MLSNIRPTIQAAVVGLVVLVAIVTTMAMGKRGLVIASIVAFGAACLPIW